MKRILSLVLALALCLSCLCISANAENLEPITIRCITTVCPLTKDLNTLPVWQELQEKTGITIEWDAVASGWDEKKAVILSSPEDMPDLWFNGLGDGDLVVNEGAFLDLAPLIEEYAPNIKKMFEELPATRAMCTDENGHIYSLPSVEPYCPSSYTVMMINKTWLDKLSLAIPTTLDELEQVLIAFRDNDCNGNGIDDEIPLDWQPGRGSIFPITALCGAWGIAEDHSADMVYVNDGKVDFVWASEPYHKLESFLGKLYAQDLINKEVFTQDYTAMMAKSKQGEQAMVGVTLGWSIEDRMGQYADQYVVLPPLKAADGVENPVWPSNPSRVKYLANKCSISAKAEHPERIIQLVDLLYTEYYSIQMTFGSIPYQLTYDADNDTYFIPDPPEGEYQENINWTNGLVNNVPKYGSAALEAKTRAPKEVTNRMDQEIPYSNSFAKEIYPLVQFDAATIEELTFLKTDMYKLVDEKMASWVVNNNVDEEWDSYIQQLENMGLSELRTIYQDAYDKKMGK